MWGKTVKVVVILVAMFIFATNVLAGDKFYYGGFHAHTVVDKFPDLRDSLRFNLVFLFDIDSNHTIDSLAKYSLKGVAEQTNQNSPMWWSMNSYYTIWEAEGFPGAGVNLSYSGGTLEYDPEAHTGSGSWARLFVGPSNADTVQRGPDYRQYGLGLGDPYFVDFNLKFKGDRSVPSKQVCDIIVETNGSIIRESTLVVGDFPTNGYKKFQLQYTLSDFRNTEFKIYWYGVDTLFVDYVSVYDQNGYDLMSGTADQRIKDYVQQPWTSTVFPGTNDTVLYRWYLKDEPQSIDCYMPYAHIDSLLKNNSPYKPGAQHYCDFPDTFAVHEYLTRENPVEYMIDPYPFGPDDTTDSAIQSRIDWLAKSLDEGKRKAEGLNKDFWVAIQAHAVGDTNSSCPEYRKYEYPTGSGKYYCLSLKDPSANELRLQTFLALCYGTDAVMSYQIPFSKTPAHIETGLYDTYASAESLKITDKWKEIKNFTGPRAEKLGPILKGLTWQGACRGDTAQWFHLRDGCTPYIWHNRYAAPSYLESYSHIGFFKDMSSSEPNYFLVVNRFGGDSLWDACTLLLNGGCDLPDWNQYAYYLYDMYLDIIEYETVKFGTSDVYGVTCHLQRGEGNLFRLISKYQRGHVFGNLIWGGWDMHVNADVIVDPGTTLKILPNTTIKFEPGTKMTISAGASVTLMDSAQFYFSTNCSLIVNGSLEALGSREDVMKFLPTGAGGPGSWSGIVVKPGGRIKMKNAYVKNATVGLTLDGASGDTVSNCMFYNSSRCGIKYLNNSNAIISYNNILQDDSVSGDTGIYMENINTGASWRVGLNYITGYDYGIYAKSCYTQIATNTIDQGVIGIYVRNCPSYLLLGTNHLNGRFSTSYIYCKKSKVWIIECELKGTSNTAYGVIYDSTNGGYMQSTKIWDYDNYGVWVNRGSLPPPNLGTNSENANNWFENCGSAYVYNSATQWLSAKYNYWNTVPPCTSTTDCSSKFHRTTYQPYLTEPPGYTPNFIGEGPAKIVASDLPTEFRLSQNYPNPFNPATTLEYDLPGDCYVTIKIYNILGQTVATLVNEQKEAGRYKINWEGKDKAGEKVSSGIYFYRINAGDFEETRKLLLIK
jgi:hypothetical protein